MSLNNYTYCEDDPVDGVNPSWHITVSLALWEVLNSEVSEVSCMSVVDEKSGEGKDEFTNKDDGQNKKIGW